jgi:transcriptional regulator with XRE-family HTH domain
MIKPHVIRKIQRLLASQQYSRRQIAELLGVARATVSAVATGKCLTDEHLDRLAETELYVDELLEDEALCEARRCLAPLGLDLKPRHQARYAQVRRWRREALRRGIVTTPHSDSD